MINQFEKTIRDNQQEFMELVIKFVNQKLTQKPTKAPKTICHFQALGKTYDDNIFSKNYEQFLRDVSKILTYNDLKIHMNRFVGLNEKDFTKSTLGNSKLLKLPNGILVSTHSTTEKKLVHIHRLCSHMGINLIKL